jgi:hypothetical protein
MFSESVIGAQNQEINSDTKVNTKIMVQVDDINTLDNSQICLTENMKHELAIWKQIFKLA